MFRFIIKNKQNQEVARNEVSSMELGDAWVIEQFNFGRFGAGDRSLTLEEAQALGLDIQEAASTSVEQRPDPQSPDPQNPIMLDVTIYHFSKEYSVEVLDISAEKIAEQKKEARFKARAFCESIVDEIAAINKDLNDPQLMATIFSTASFQAIILALLTGGTATARALMVAHGPSLYPQATVDSLVAKMDAYIASES